MTEFRLATHNTKREREQGHQQQVKLLLALDSSSYIMNMLITIPARAIYPHRGALYYRQQQLARRHSSFSLMAELVE